MHPRFVAPPPAKLPWFASGEAWLAALALLAWQAGAFAAAPAAVAPQPERIRAVTSGQCAEARASWWGFDPADSTQALQAAIQSGAKKLLVENLGSPWVVDKIQLASDQEIVFAPGTVVLAKRGAFKGATDSLFSASLQQNITLTGPGATLKMWKQDYDDPAQYTHAEWRHVLNFRSCANVRITGLTLAGSGGDGIYLGVAKRGVPCTDFVIREVQCLDNYRQGISVISARNLLIEHCLLKDTGGTAPQAGIDFEPNHPSEELVNCVMRHCVSENNRGDAYVLYLPPLRADSQPISVRLENCIARGGRSSARFVTGNDSESAGVKGSMEFVDCLFEDSAGPALVVSDKPLTGARVSFTRCQVRRPAAAEPAASPIQISGRATGVDTIGGIHFADCLVEDSLERQPMSYHDMSGGVGLREITGTLILQRGGQPTTVALTPERISEWMPHRSFKQIGRFETKGLRFEPVFPSSATPAPAPPRLLALARQRGLSEWLIWVEAGQRASFQVAVRAIGKTAPHPAGISLIAPSGKLSRMAPAGPGQETAYDFTAAETGAHRIVCEAGSFAAAVFSSTHRICLYSESASLHFIGATGTLHFWVPAGTKEFAVRVSGENSSECVKATLFDPQGQPVQEQDNIAAAHQFVASPLGQREGESWSLRFEKPSTGVLEDFHVRLQGIPPLLAHARESLLRPAK